MNELWNWLEPRYLPNITVWWYYNLGLIFTIATHPIILLSLIRVTSVLRPVRTGMISYILENYRERMVEKLGNDWTIKSSRVQFYYYIHIIIVSTYVIFLWIIRQNPNTLVTQGHTLQVLTPNALEIVVTAINAFAIFGLFVVAFNIQIVFYLLQRSMVAVRRGIKITNGAKKIECFGTEDIFVISEQGDLKKAITEDDYSNAFLICSWDIAKGWRLVWLGKEGHDQPMWSRAGKAIGIGRKPVRVRDNDIFNWGLDTKIKIDFEVTQCPTTTTSE